MPAASGKRSLIRFRIAAARNAGRSIANTCSYAAQKFLPCFASKSLPLAEFGKVPRGLRQDNLRIGEA
jgi:hypothetical protein